MIQLKIILLSLGFIGINLCAQKTLNETDAAGLKQGAWKKTVNGELIYQGSFLNNQPIGSFIRYQKGIKITEQYFPQGDSLSSIKFFDTNQNIIVTGQYYHQKKEGLWEYFSHQGAVIKRENYTHNMLTGEKLIYSAEGNLLDLSNWLNGIQHGERKMYYTNGETEVACNYSKGKLDGRYVSFYDNASKRSEGSYQKGNKTGVWNFYYANNGVISESITYIDGVPQQKISAKDFQKQLNEYETKHLEDPENYMDDPNAYLTKQKSK